MSSAKPKHFHCYATANDSRLYLRDLKNLKRLKNTHSGVQTISLFIAISNVRNENWFDKLFAKRVYSIFENHSKIKVIEILHKTNIGRDFSSYKFMLDRVKAISTDNDFIFFQNRSARGPFITNWYQLFIDQFQKFDSIALCGTTINFNDHPSRSERNDLPHIQTYSFLSTLFFMNQLGDNFPGSDETERLEIITKGEIGLSQFFLKENKITCMEWPDKAIDNQSQPPQNVDVKSNVTLEHCFYHRSYFRRNKRKK